MCWNRQTGTFEGRVSYGVWVQVPSLAPKKCKGSRQMNNYFLKTSQSIHSVSGLLPLIIQVSQKTANVMFAFFLGRIKSIYEVTIYIEQKGE